MLLSLGQAARLAGKPKTTIARAIASSRLSAGRNYAGGYAIQVAELERVYPLKSPEQPAQATNGVQSATENAMGELVSVWREQLADVKVERDHWREIATRLAIADRRERRPWWKRVAG